MTTDEIVTRLLSECPSLTAAERERAQRPFDKLYIDECIRRRRRLLWASRLAMVFWLLLNLATLLVLLLTDTHRDYILVLSITLLVLFVLSLAWVRAAFVNHGRNIAILRVIRDIQSDQGMEQQEQPTQTLENAGTDSPMILG